jgi:uncharacterized membrane protein
MTVEAIRTFLGEEPVALFAVLCAIVALIYALSEVKFLSKIFDILPTVFWIYFVPMLFATFGFFPEKSPTFTFVRDYFLPASLFLLFVSASIPELLKLGPRTILVMLIASCTIVVGSIVAVLAVVPLFKSGLLPAEHLSSLWKGVAALSASWTGGSANLAAVWESLTSASKTDAEQQIFSAIVAVDVCVGYPWMGFLIALAGRQIQINRWLRADTTRIEEINKRMQAVQQAERPQHSTGKFVYMIALAISVAFTCKILGTKLNAGITGGIESPLWRSVFGAFAITIVLVTLTGLALSLTRVSKLETYGASKLGYALLFIVLARIGAEGNLKVIKEFPAYLILGVVWILVHGAILLLVMRLMRVPLFFGVTASQANVGGPVSAPVVAAAHQPSLAVVGLLMAILGNIIGTFVGLFAVAPIAHWLTNAV